MVTYLLSQKKLYHDCLHINSPIPSRSISPDTEKCIDDIYGKIVERKMFLILHEFNNDIINNFNERERTRHEKKLNAKKKSFFYNF